jgi:hypothetical protein
VKEKRYSARVLRQLPSQAVFDFRAADVTSAVIGKCNNGDSEGTLGHGTTVASLSDLKCSALHLTRI